MVQLWQVRECHVSLHLHWHRTPPWETPHNTLSLTAHRHLHAHLQTHSFSACIPFHFSPTLFFDHGRFRRSRPSSVHPPITATSLTDCLATVSHLSFLQLVQPCTHHFPHRQQSHRCFSHRRLFISTNFPHPKCNPRRKYSPRYLPFSTKPQLLVRTRLHPQPPRAHRQAGCLYSLLLSSLPHL